MQLTIRLLPKGCHLESEIRKAYNGACSSGALIHTFAGHSSNVTSVAFSSDADRLVSASEDGTVKVWDVKRRRLFATFLGAATGDWVTYIPEGYFIGSDAMIERTLREFRRNEARFPERLFPRDNPNPRKVAEALGGAIHEQRAAAAAAPREPFAGDREKSPLLGR